MYFVSGYDSEDRQYWLDSNSQWRTAPTHAKTFREDEAYKKLTELRNRNKYLDPEDQIAAFMAKESRNGS